MKKHFSAALCLQLCLLGRFLPGRKKSANPDGHSSDGPLIGGGTMERDAGTWLNELSPSGTSSYTSA